MGERTVILDCDVIQADGGTRTTAITGAFIAMALAFQKLRNDGKIGKIPVIDYLAAVSVGIVEGRPCLDLCYLEDAQADVDMNIVMTESGNFVEIQGTAEQDSFSRDQMNDLISLAEKGIGELVKLQREIVDIPLLEKK
jgi:ribonuclease PH